MGIDWFLPECNIPFFGLYRWFLIYCTCLFSSEDYNLLYNHFSCKLKIFDIWPILCHFGEKSILLDLLISWKELPYPILRSLILLYDQAAEGFCRKNGVPLSSLYRRVDGISISTCAMHLVLSCIHAYIHACIHIWDFILFLTTYKYLIRPL